MGGDAPVSVQTMTRRPAEEVDANLAEIAAATAAGCDLVRLAVPSVAAAASFGRIAARAGVPLVADTHFDLAATLAAISNGAAKVRINPGNMNPDSLARVADAAGAAGIPIRVGGNSGSIRHRSGDQSEDIAQLLADEALGWADKLDRLGFRDIVISVKAPDALSTVRANRIIAAACDYPLHLGVTAAGPKADSLFKSAAAIGSLLLDGIGDTIRFSFTGDMIGEVEAGLELLRALELRQAGPRIIACPGCGRCRMELSRLVDEVKQRTSHLPAGLKIAVMGCEVNGPGEAREADVGIASAGGQIYLFAKGEVVEKMPAAQAVDALVRRAEALGGDPL